ncbi:hypothetical protein PR048_033558 [Dryococelus australis]|uniref:Uncharacterized protein n=1 Tax=Dryococelus australis TaxID=614101 RepID=A0ABQ9G0L4_9NEOP|nr:hypothetical protein PR048_033558 [Dryococelus australis]
MRVIEVRLWSGAGTKGSGKREISEKTRRLAEIVRHVFPLAWHQCEGITPYSGFELKRFEVENMQPEARSRNSGCGEPSGSGQKDYLIRDGMYEDDEPAERRVVVRVKSADCEHRRVRNVNKILWITIGTPLDDSGPMADLHGNKQRIPYCQVWGNSGQSLWQQPINRQVSSDEFATRAILLRFCTRGCSLRERRPFRPWPRVIITARPGGLKSPANGPVRQSYCRPELSRGIIAVVRLPPLSPLACHNNLVGKSPAGYRI